MPLRCARTFWFCACAVCRATTGWRGSESRPLGLLVRMPPYASRLFFRSPLVVWNWPQPALVLTFEPAFALSCRSTSSQRDTLRMLFLCKKQTRIDVSSLRAHAPRPPRSYPFIIMTTDDAPLISARQADAVMVPVEAAGITGGFEDAAAAAPPSASGRSAAPAAAAGPSHPGHAMAGPAAALPAKPKFAALSAHDQNGRRIEFRRVRGKGRVRVRSSGSKALSLPSQASPPSFIIHHFSVSPPSRLLLHHPRVSRSPSPSTASPRLRRPGWTCTRPSPPTSAWTCA